MAQQLSIVNTNTDTFLAWVTRTNEIINVVNTTVVTANNNANGAITIGNTLLIGIFSANTITAISELRGGNVQSSASLNVTSNLNITGNIFTIGNSTVNSTVNSTTLTIGTTVVNSTVLAAGANVILNTAQLSIGNSTVNTFMNSSIISLNGASLITSSLRDSIALANTQIGTRSRINFIPGSSVQLDITDDGSGNQVNVIIGITSGNPGFAFAGGSNTQVQFNDGGNLGATAGFTFDKALNNVLIANTLSLGNSTVNSTVNSTTLTIGTTVVNSTVLAAGANAILNPNRLTIGNSTVNTFVNTTALSTGANVVLDAVHLRIGNSTVNAIVNSTVLYLGSTVVNSTAFAAGANVVLNTTQLSIGNSTVNVIANSTVLRLANSTVNTYITVPNTTQYSATNYFLHANGSWVQFSTPPTTFIADTPGETRFNTFTTTGTTTQIVDSFTKSSLRSAEYIMSIKNNSANGYQITKLLLIHDDSTIDAYITEYGTINTNNALGTFSANSNTTHTILYFTPIPANTTVKFSRTALTV